MRGAVSDAVLHALAEQGADKLSVAEVAARAGVHETSIYRRWGTREKLIVDVLLGYSEQRLPIPDTGSIRGDLTALAGSLRDYLSTPLGTALTRTLASTGDDPVLAEHRTAFWSARHRQVGVIIERAVARGELPADTDARLALEALIAPMHFRVLLTREPLDDQLPGRLADLVLNGLAAPESGADRRSHT